MRKIIFPIFLAIVFFVLGAVFFLVRRNWLLVHWVPAYKVSDDISGVLGKKVAPKKNIFLYYWRDDDLKKERVNFVWLDNKAEILKLIVGNWLTYMYEERVLEKKVGVDSVSLSMSEQEAYVSFDQIPFLREWSIHKKWRLLDGLLRTVGDAGLGIEKIIFLVRHEIMRDDHLDFSQPWPVDLLKT